MIPTSDKGLLTPTSLAGNGGGPSLEAKGGGSPGTPWELAQKVQMRKLLKL